MGETESSFAFCSSGIICKLLFNFKVDRMSKIVTTELGRFRQVVDSAGVKSFLFECPECKEWLPLSEAHLAGELAPIHFARTDEMVTMTHGRVCYFAKKQNYGATLVSTIQARLLMDEAPHDMEPLCPDSPDGNHHVAPIGSDEEWLPSKAPCYYCGDKQAS